VVWGKERGLTRRLEIEPTVYHVALEILTVLNRPRSIYQYSNMASRLSGQTSTFGVVFFVSKCLLGI